MDFIGFHDDRANVQRSGPGYNHSAVWGGPHPTQRGGAAVNADRAWWKYSSLCGTKTALSHHGGSLP